MDARPPAEYLDLPGGSGDIDMDGRCRPLDGARPLRNGSEQAQLRRMVHRNVQNPCLQPTRHRLGSTRCVHCTPSCGCSHRALARKRSSATPLTLPAARRVDAPEFRRRWQSFASLPLAPAYRADAPEFRKLADLRRRQPPQERWRWTRNAAIPLRLGFLCSSQNPTRLRAPRLTAAYSRRAISCYPLVVVGLR